MNIPISATRDWATNCRGGGGDEAYHQGIRRLGSGPGSQSLRSWSLLTLPSRLFEPGGVVFWSNAKKARRGGRRPEVMKLETQN
jgi:hypothetical protein